MADCPLQCLSWMCITKVHWIWLEQWTYSYSVFRGNFFRLFSFHWEQIEEPRMVTFRTTNLKPYCWRWLSVKRWSPTESGAPWRNYKWNSFLDNSTETLWYFKFGIFGSLYTWEVTSSDYELFLPGRRATSTERESIRRGPRFVWQLCGTKENFLLRPGWPKSGTWKWERHTHPRVRDFRPLIKRFSISLFHLKTYGAW